MSVTFSLTSKEQQYLGEVARFGIMSGFAGSDPQDMPAPPTGVLHEPLGSFVTLTLGGDLRGCIGSIIGQEPLYKNIARMACAAAFEDPRFPPLTPEEWARADMEISVLGPLTPCPGQEAPQAVEVGRHGLLLQLGNRSGVFLPKVPVEQGWDVHAYLENLCRKAGLPGGSWQHPEARLFWYEALVFSVRKERCGV